jgi:hypothetical protein
MEDEARFRRKLRIEKLRSLRRKKEPSYSLFSEESVVDDSSSLNSVIKDRKVRNRESALKSRKRKNDEINFLRSRVNSLEEEVRRLKSRLMLYEDVDGLKPQEKRQFMNICKSSLEPAVFTL